MADATAKLTGYLVDAITVSFSGTQTLSSLADNEWTDLSDEIDNSSNKYALCDMEIYLAALTTTGSDAGIEVYIVPSLDGTNYPDWLGNSTSDAQENNNYYAGFMPVKVVTTTAVRSVLRNVTLPNGKFKFGVRNRANVALAASSNTLKYRPHSFFSDE
jgi:hypothetical protein